MPNPSHGACELGSSTDFQNWGMAIFPCTPWHKLRALLGSAGLCWALLGSALGFGKCRLKDRWAICSEGLF